MKAIDIRNYDTQITIKDEDGATVPQMVPYEVTSSLINLLFASPNLSALELLARDDVARKIRDCQLDSVSLEENEYVLLKTAVEVFKGYRQNDLELVKRVLFAQTVDPNQKKA